MRPPVDTIPAPPFPPKLPWVNVAMLRMEKQIGRPVLVEFWDFCRPNSIRTLPYLKAWHERYAGDGLRVVGVHTSGFPPSEDPDAVRAAVLRLEIPYPVVIDVERRIWEQYGNAGWPGRYLWDRRHHLADLHYGEGAYAETERLIQELLGVERDVVEPVRPEDAEGAVLVPQTEDVAGPYSGPYAAGGVWIVVSGEGEVAVDGRAVPVAVPGCLPVAEHPRHTEAVIAIEPGPGVTVHATCFTPGLAA